MPLIHPQTRDDPQSEAEAILMLRASLRVMTDAFEHLLDHGPPKKGRSNDDKDAHAAWHEDQGANIRRAREALELTKEMSA